MDAFGPNAANQIYELCAMSEKNNKSKRKGKEKNEVGFESLEKMMQQGRCAVLAPAEGIVFSVPLASASTVQ